MGVPKNYVLQDWFLHNICHFSDTTSDPDTIQGDTF